MKQDIAQLKGFIDHTFTLQSNMLGLYQTLADHFYPERADFTVIRNVGSEFADNLVDSYPVLVRRDLGNSFHAMLRDGEWFQLGIDGSADLDGQQWLKWAGVRLLGMFNNRKSNFVRSVKEGDHDYATFGQAVISIELNKQANGLLFRCWHLRDVAWFDDEAGQIGGVARKWTPTQKDLVKIFGEEKVSPEIVKDYHKNPFKSVQVRHIVIPSSMYGDEEIEGKFPWVSIFIDYTHDHVIEATGMNYNMYIIPRFQTIAGSAYAYSPATVVGLPNARALQAMTHTLLEAGERYARPPIIATQKVIRGDIDLSPDGITYVSDDYDEKMGAALRPMAQDRGGWPIGKEIREGVVDVLSSAFYLDKLSLPDKVGMTATEVMEYMKQFRRQNLPLFAPMESDYNGQLCDAAFTLAMDSGLLGSPYDIPQSLSNSDVEFKFKSPLTQSEEEERANRFSQVNELLGQAVQHDQMVTANVNFDEAVRDAILGIGAPAQWLNDVEDVMKGRESAAQLASIQAMQEMSLQGQG